MQHVSALRPVSTVASKAAALAAYDAALASPAVADWQTVAHMLRAALPGSRAKSEPASAIPAWWQDYKLPKDYSRDSALVTFADGEAVRVNIHTAGKKGPRVAKACRVAIAFYRARTGRDSVPAIASIENLSSGQTWDAAECSRLTADLRAAPLSPTPSKATGEARPEWAGETELERVRRIFPNVAWRVVSMRRAFTRNGSNQVEYVWRDEIVRDFSAPAASHPPVEEIAIPVEEIATAALEPIEAIEAAVPCPVEAIAEPEPVVGIALCPVVGQICRTDCAHRPGCDLAASYAQPVEEIGCEPASATERENAADLSTEADPLATHTIVAVCTSHRGREKLFDLIQDGCFPCPKYSTSAIHGAFRITIQDAREIGHVPGIILRGLPRKPRSKAVEPVEAVQDHASDEGRHDTAVAA